MIDALRQEAAQLLKDGRVKLVIGYQERAGRRVPSMITQESQAGTLIFDDQCEQNLAAYLRKDEVRRRFPVALVAPPAVLRSLMVLAAESQLADGQVIALAVEPGQFHGALDLAGAAKLLSEKFPALAPSPETLQGVARLAAMTEEERSRFWAEQFAKCTRCYACRAACPGCYCKQCIVEKNVPQWISSAAAGHGNYAWNIIRAFHLAGRCTACGACEAACPQGIPLMLLNAKVGADVEEEYGAKPGYDPKEKPFIGSWKPDDKEEFIR